jgi:2,4-dienoyl-CoA reductase-like NADH-dependent reductase (Old Yellow Enzyme family)/thioredoxin reductase
MGFPHSPSSPTFNTTGKPKEMNPYEKLLTPFQIGRLLIKNRIVFAPVATNLGDENGHATAALVEYYSARAKGGVGLIVLESCAVAPEGGAVPKQINICSDASVEGYRKLTDAVHQYGTKILLQLQHAGRSSVTAEVPVAPSPIPCPMVGKVPRELSRTDLEMLIRQFGDATGRAKEAGFDGVEVHLAHGYLLNEFLSPLSNQRTDEFGGSFENRLRFPLQVIHKVKEVAGGDLTVTCRISGSEFMEGGLTLDDMKAISQEVVQAGIEAVSVSGGTYGSVEWIIQPPSIERGCFFSMAEEIKKTVSVPITVAGRIDPEKALEAIQEGKADLVAVGRGLVADAEWANKLKQGKRENIIPCISCNQGCIERVFAGNHITCLLNPRSGRESQISLVPADSPKEIVVIGGGPAGLKAAEIAARRGHSVTLYEKNEELGGQFRLASIPPHKEVFGEGLDSLIREAQQAGAEIVRNFTVNEENVVELKGDAAILAIGGEPLIPDIPGVKEERVVLAEEILTEKVKPGSNLAIIGGGLVGCEVASFLLERGVSRITILEMLPDVAQDMMIINKIALMKHFAQQENLTIITSATVTSLEDGKVTYSKDGKESAQDGCDTIVIAVGYKSRDGLEQALRKHFDKVEIIGDCKSPRKALEAVEEGFFAGFNL